MTVEEIVQMFKDAEELTIFPPKCDRKFKAIKLLRERIPYEKCNEIVCYAEHDIIYLCGIEDAAPHLNQKDIEDLIR